jgi:hypothetical protein
MLTAVALFLVACSALAGGSDDLSLELGGPVTAAVGQRLELRFTATNTGPVGLYFKQPWKWASNGMRVIAESTDGSRMESTLVLLDIDARYLCTYFKRLAPRKKFSFAGTLFIGPVSDPSSPSFVETALYPHLDLQPGLYRLRWVYEPKLYPHEQKCTSKGWPIWSGRAESAEIELRVEQ